MKLHKSDFAMIHVTAALLFVFVPGFLAMAADFPQGLMLHFSFDRWESGGVIADKTGRNNNGHAVGAKWTAAGKQTGGYEFTATNNYIQVTNSPTLNPKQATFAVWFKAGKVDVANRYILEKSAEKGYVLNIAGDHRNSKSKGKLCFSISGHDCLSDNVVTDNTWHHGTATFDGNNLKLYVDGQLQQQVTAWKGGIAANTNDLTIGLNRSNPTPQEKGLSYEGTIDEVMIFDHSLTDAEVKVVIAATKPKFTREQVTRRLAELKELLDRGLILQDFYDRKVKECEVTQ